MLGLRTISRLGCCVGLALLYAFYPWPKSLSADALTSGVLTAAFAALVLVGFLVADGGLDADSGWNWTDDSNASSGDGDSSTD